MIYVRSLILTTTIFDDVRGDADSLAGLLLELMQRMPERGEKVTYRRFTFTAKAVDKRRIKKVLVNIFKAGIAGGICPYSHSLIQELRMRFQKCIS
jgi:hypothetical protein